MEKRILVFFLAVFLLLSAAGCSMPENVSPVVPTETVFSVENYPLQITADSTFRENTGGSFDLQITNDRCYVSIMAYAYIDLPSDTTPLDVFTLQNQEILNRREAVTLIEEAATQTTARYLLTQALYSAEKDGTKNYYATYLLDFPQDQVFAWVLVTAAPSYLTGNREMLHDIVCSLTPVQ